MDSNTVDPSGLSMLERQQLSIVAPGAHTFWHWVRFEIVAKVARSQGARVILDIGAGSGMLGDWIASSASDITYRFSELSKPLDDALVEHFGECSRYPTSQAIGPDTVVALLDVLEHIEDDIAALTEIAERMEAGSTIVVTVPAMQWAFSSWDTELGHYRRYSRSQLRQAMTDAGLTVETSEYLFPELFVLLPIRKLRRTQRSDVDFPELSPMVNRIGYWVSATSARLRRWWPLGTSVIAVASKQASND